MLTLVDELTLLALGEQSGAVVNAETGQRLPYALAGAMLMDLVLAGRVALDGAVVVVRDRSPLPCPVLSATLFTLAAAPTPLTQTQWVRRLAPDAHAAVPQLIAGLVGRGILRADVRDGHRIYPERDGHAEAEARGRILAVVRGQAPPDFRTHIMVCLVHTAALVPTLFPPIEQAPAAGRVREIAANVPVFGSIAQAERAAGISEQAGPATSMHAHSGVPGGAIAAGAVGVAAVGFAAAGAAGVTPEEIARKVQHAAQDVGGDVIVDGIGEVVEVAVAAVDVGAVVGGVFEIIGGIFSLFDS